METLFLIGGAILFIIIVFRLSVSPEGKERRHAATVAHRCYEQGLDERATERNAIDAAVAYLKMNQPDYTTQDVTIFVQSVLYEYDHDKGF